MSVDEASDRVASLRGASVAGSGRRVGQIALGSFLAIAAVLLVVGFISASNDQARISRLRSSGIPVTVTVAGCIGNLGGSGSNGAGYTCHGSYVVQGRTYHEVIGGEAAYVETGRRLSGVADPSQPSTVVLANSVAQPSSSTGSYVLLVLLTVAYLALLGYVAFRVLHARREPATSD
jgi:hypothetical protein